VQRRLNPLCLFFVIELTAVNDDDDRIIRQRIAGRSVRAIAKACDAVAEINRVIDRWAETVGQS